MKFCCNCASPVVKRVPPGDTHPRWVCDQCGEIHYQNPRLVVGSIPEFEGKLLLCRRAIEPRYGYWTLPAGFMENGESTAQAALRETLEEAGAQVELGEDRLRQAGERRRGAEKRQQLRIGLRPVRIRLIHGACAPTQVWTTTRILPARPQVSTR